MRIQILGTAAGEGWPALFCDCPACRRAREAGGKNLRTRSSVQVDDLLKIDLPPDTLMHVHKHALGLHRLRYLLISHSHADHLRAAELEYLFSPFAVPERGRSLRIYGNRESIALINEKISLRLPEDSGLLSEIESGSVLELAPYTVTTIKAFHGTDRHPLNFIIERGGRSLLYTCDTGLYEDDTWDFLNGRRVDLVISECTEGPNRATYKTHLGFPDVLDFRQRAEAIGLTDTGARWVLTHFSHGGGLLHEELEALAGPEGFEVAWDGMEIEL